MNKDKLKKHKADLVLKNATVIFITAFFAAGCAGSAPVTEDMPEVTAAPEVTAVPEQKSDADARAPGKENTTAESEDEWFGIMSEAMSKNSYIKQESGRAQPLAQYAGKWYFHATEYDTAMGEVNAAVSGSEMTLDITGMSDIDISPLKTVTFNEDGFGISAETVELYGNVLKGVFTLTEDDDGTERMFITFVKSDGVSPLQPLFMYRQEDRSALDPYRE